MLMLMTSLSSWEPYRSTLITPNKENEKQRHNVNAPKVTQRVVVEPGWIWLANSQKSPSKGKKVPLTDSEAVAVRQVSEFMRSQVLSS